MEHLLLLHGAIGSAAQLLPLKKLLEEKFHVHSFNFNGHGGEPFSGEPFSIEAFATEINNFLVAHAIERVYIFGYSMGGYAALHFAVQYPEKSAGVVTLATKFHWDEATAAKETAMLDPLKMEEKIPAFARTLAARHLPNDWKMVLQKTSAMMLEMGRQNPLHDIGYSKIEIPVLLMLGDRDKMVSLQETLDIYKTLARGALCVLPDTDHPVEKTDAGRIAFEIEKFVSVNN